MLSDGVQAGLNEQLNAEFFSAYLYFQMSAYVETLALRGIAHWLYVQAHEELTHALKIYRHLIDRRAAVQLAPLEAPQVAWESPLAAFEAAHAHEQLLTGDIDRLVDLALEEDDRATYTFLQWYVAEQIEEEQITRDVVAKLRMVGDQGSGLLLVDRELGARVPPFVIPIPPGVTEAPAAGGAA